MRFLLTCTAGLENITRRKILSIYPRARVQYTYFKGVLLAEIPDTPENVVKKLAAVETLAKVFPVYAECRAEPNEIANTLLSLKHLWPKEGETFKVEVRRRGQHSFTSRELERSLGALIPGKVDLERPDVLVRVDILQDKAYISIARKDEFLTKEPAVKKKWMDRERPLNRAQLKIEEVMQKYPEILQNTKTVIDLGAAPGGWSYFLASQGKIVYAVDPAELKVKHPNIVHVRYKLEEFLPNNLRAELVTCDINDEPEKILPRVVELARQVGAKYIVFTVKLPDIRASTVQTKLQYVKQVLESAGYKLLFLGKLKANTRYERTAVAAWS
ncbi:MAG: hypothetical protein GXO42_03120 [bacterium]|nr:hypothetical protein [bacterium]